MFNLRITKVTREVFQNFQKSILVVLSIAVGIFGVGTILFTQYLIGTFMTSEYLSVSPNHFSLAITPGFDTDLVRGIESLPEVEATEGVWAKTVRWKVHKNDPWFDDIQLQARMNYNKSVVDIVKPSSGASELKRGELALERQSLLYLAQKKNVPIQFGDSIFLELPTGDEREVKIVTTYHNINGAPSSIMGTVYGFVNFDTVEWLGYKRLFTSLRVHLTRQFTVKEDISPIADKAKDIVERGGRTVTTTRIPDPGKHPADAPISAILAIMGILGFLTLFLSGFLVANTITAIITQQIRQIGILKAIGSNTTQITVMYVFKVFLYGSLSYIVGAYFAYWGGRGLAGFLSGMINFDIPDYSIPQYILLIEAAIALLVPLLASLLPIRQGTSMPVVHAVYHQGAQTTNKHDVISEFLHAIRMLPGPLVLALRNTFKERKRLALSLITLTLGGAIFMGVFSVRSALFGSITDALRYNKYDVIINFRDTHSIPQIERQANAVENVAMSECWGNKTVQRVNQDDSLSDDVTLVAPPAESKLIDPILLEGRWIKLGDRQGVVANTEFIDKFPDITLGTHFTLKVGTHKKPVVLVGIVKGILAQPSLYMDLKGFGLFTDSSNQSNQLLISLYDKSTDARDATARRIESRFEDLSQPLSSTQTLDKFVSSMETRFSILVIFLSIMAVLIALVGGLGLAGLMSINVLERIREIGVLRSIGAGDILILGVFIVEGVIIGITSCLLAIILSVPFGALLGYAVGIAFMKTPLAYSFSGISIVIWAVLVLVIAVVASAFPAWQATRITIRDVLANE